MSKFVVDLKDFEFGEWDEWTVEMFEEAVDSYHRDMLEMDPEWAKVSATQKA